MTNRRTRRAMGERGSTASGPACSHCGTARVVMPLSIMRGFARKHAALVDLLGALETMRDYYGPHDYVSLCPGCFCLTGDPAELTGPHVH